MAWFKVYLSDTVTYERSVVVNINAADAVTACERALERADTTMAMRRDVEEVQIDNTPYTAVLADRR